MTRAINLKPYRDVVCCFILGLSACASTHDMKDGEEGFWGGGYLIEELSTGVFHITTKTNAAQWANYSAARKMWDKHAHEACGDRSYSERDITEYDYKDIPDFLWNRYIIAVKEGIAVCGDVEELSHDQVID